MARATKYTGKALLDRTMTERQLQEVLRQAFQYHGWKYYHTHDSRHSPEGFPDGVAIRGPVLLVEESKTEAGRVTVEQAEWLAAFAGVSRVETYVIRPHNLDEALAIIGTP